MRKGAMIAGWVAATAVTTAVAYLAVGAAGARVNNRPLSVITAASPSSTSPSLSTTSAVPATTTAPTSTTTVTSTSSSTATSATTAAPEDRWKQQTINSAAGTVVVSFRGDEVRLESVAPLAGFAYEIDDNGPDEVRVEFDGTLRVEIRARVRDGVLTTEINENS